MVVTGLTPPDVQTGTGQDSPKPSTASGVKWLGEHEGRVKQVGSDLFFTSFADTSEAEDFIGGVEFPVKRDKDGKLELMLDGTVTRFVSAGGVLVDTMAPQTEKSKLILDNMKGRVYEIGGSDEVNPKFAYVRVYESKGEKRKPARLVLSEELHISSTNPNQAVYIKFLREARGLRNVEIRVAGDVDYHVEETSGPPDYAYLVRKYDLTNGEQSLLESNIAFMRVQPDIVSPRVQDRYPVAKELIKFYNFPDLKDSKVDTTFERMQELRKNLYSFLSKRASQK
jgi:hypothetical protein